MWNLALVFLLLAGDEPSAAEKEQVEAALKLTREAANKYSLRANTNKSDAKLLPEPILRWSNPAVGEIHGNVFLWTMDPRPAALGSLFKWFSPHKHTSHEFQLLSEARLRASYDGKEVWRTKEAGVKFVELRGIEPPADSQAKRLTQMRQIAKRFTGHETTREGVEFELRLLPQPIYRYAAPEQDVVDGGLFALVQGTDPDILLLLEARPKSNPRWHCAGARLQNTALELRFDQKQVWQVEQLAWSVAFDHAQPYTLFDTPGK